MIILCILLAPVALANTLTLYIAWRRYMSTPDPLGNLPVTGHNVLALIEHAALVDVAGPLATYFAAMQAATKAGVSADMVTLKTQLVGNMIAAAPHLFGDVLGDLVGLANYGLAKGVAATAAKVTPAA